MLTADALARVGRSREALAELDAAWSLLAVQDGRTDEWMYDFDEGSLAIHTGTCLLTLGRPESAATAFTDALRLLPASCARRGAEISGGTCGRMVDVGGSGGSATVDTDLSSDLRCSGFGGGPASGPAVVWAV